MPTLFLFWELYFFLSSFTNKKARFKIGLFSKLIFSNYKTFWTFPDFKQEVQTLIFLTVPFSQTFTVWRFGAWRCTICLWEKVNFADFNGVFPHISHCLDMIFPLYNLFYNSSIYQKKIIYKQFLKISLFLPF